MDILAKTVMECSKQLEKTYNVSGFSFHYADAGYVHGWPVLFWACWPFFYFVLLIAGFGGACYCSCEALGPPP
jgi:hypothetical protein